MSQASPDQPTPEWLQKHLTELLSSPYIHFSQPKVPGLRLRMGPGPIDLFSTKFANMVTGDATGVVAGKEVDKEGLKEALLKLQKKWNRDAVKVVDGQPAEGHTTATKLLWTPKDTEGELQVAASASVRHEGGLNRISQLRLDADPSLFE